MKKWSSSYNIFRMDMFWRETLGRKNTVDHMFPVCVCSHNTSTDSTHKKHFSSKVFLFYCWDMWRGTNFQNIIWSRNPLWSTKRSPAVSNVTAVSFCFGALYFFSSTVLPKYSFWNCWNSSSVNKDCGSLAFLAGRSGRFLDCLPELWLRI